MKQAQKYISVLTFIFLMSVGFASAQTQTYTPLVPDAFPGTNFSTATTNLASFLGQVFNWAIALAVVLALVMIIWGGIEYMTTDSWNKKDEGKTRITEALKGLALALISWLLLYTINPTLVTFSGNSLLSNTQVGSTIPSASPQVSNLAPGSTPTCYNNRGSQVCSQSTVQAPANTGQTPTPTPGVTPTPSASPSPTVTATPASQTPTATPTPAPTPTQ